MKNNKNQKKKNLNQKNIINNLPTVSLCTPTFNRRPFWPSLILSIQEQDYPLDLIEWIIIDDGTDHIEDLVKDIPNVKYIKYDEKLALGKKRNILHNNTTGDIIINIDDDDFYPSQRIKHAVMTLHKNPEYLCAGSSILYIFFGELDNSLYKFGPYGPNHTTAATMAFKKELLTITQYDETAVLAEERSFLKSYTIPVIQLDPFKTILVLSHIYNTTDKKLLLRSISHPKSKISHSYHPVSKFIQNPLLKKFYIDNLNNILKDYTLGTLDYKPDIKEFLYKKFGIK